MLFQSDSESQVEEAEIKPQPKKRCKSSIPAIREHSSKPSSSRSEPRQPSTKRAKINPITQAPRSSTAHDLFGTDSDDDEPEGAVKKNGNKAILSYLTKKVANGYNRQVKANAVGSHYVELKVYNCADIENVLPVNRWRHAVLTYKCRMNPDSEPFKDLNKLVASAKKDFRDCPRTFISSYY